MDTQILGISAALGSAASWAIGSILFEKIGTQLSPLAMTLTKGTISALILVLTLLLTGYETVDQQALLLLIFSGLLGISLGDTFFFQALQHLGAHSLVLLSTIGEVLTILLAVIILGETPTRLAWLGMGLVILGITIVLSNNISGEKKASGVRGIIFGLLAVICMSISIIVAKQGLTSVSTIQATLIRMVSGTTGILFVGLATGRVKHWILPLQEFKLFRLLLLSVCFITFGGFWLSLVALKYIDVSIAHTLNSTDPLFVLLVAALFFREQITFRAIIGSLVTLSGIVLISTG